MNNYSQVAILISVNAMVIMDEATETALRNVFSRQTYFNNHEYTVFHGDHICWDLADDDIKTIQSYIDKIIDMREDAEGYVEVLIITPNGEEDDVEHYSSALCDEDRLEQVSHIQCDGIVVY